MIETEPNRAAVAGVMAILSGTAPIEKGADLLAPDVVCNVDDWRFEGINVWANWIRYVRAHGRVTALTVLLDELVTNADGTITARGRFTGLRDGRRVISKACSARYRLAGGRIVEVWSTRRNYALMCGRHVEHRAGFALEMLRVWWWKTRTPQLDLTDRARDEIISLLDHGARAEIIQQAAS